MPFRLFDTPLGRPTRMLMGFAMVCALAFGVGAAPVGGERGPETVRRLADLSAPQAAAAAPAKLVKLQDLSADEARLWNASLPTALAPNPAARPFVLDAGTLSQARASDCLTAAVYYEAGQESVAGQEAVAQVVLNRLRHPAFPKSVCGVVFQGSERTTGCQFTFTCDGSLARAPSIVGWARARAVADAALAGHVDRQVGHATHYHADYVSPYWSAELLKVATIGRHIFYRWTGRGGLSPAFSGTYAGGEGDPMGEQGRPELTTMVRVEVEAARPVAAPEAPELPAPIAPPVGPALTIEDLASMTPAGSPELTPETPADAYQARAEAGPAGVRSAMPSSLF